MPHEFFACFYNQQKRKFMEAMAGRENAALQFWQSMKQTDFIKKHPDMPKSQWRTTVPVGMHGDGASFSKQDSVYVFSWNSLIGSGTTVQKRFIATIMNKSDMVDGSMQAITRVLSWSFNVLLPGRTIALDWEGRPHGWGRHSFGWRLARCALPGEGGLAVLLRAVQVPPMEFGRSHVLAMQGPSTGLGSLRTRCRVERHQVEP